MNIWNITGSKYNIEQFKSSKYFIKELGMSNTVEKSKGERELRDGQFSSWYYAQNKSLIFKIGRISSINFYVDYYLVKKDIIGFFMHGYEDKHQYAITWDQDFVDKNGVDLYLSKLLGEVDEAVEYSKIPKEKVENNKNEGDASKVINSPGSATWDDIAAHIKNKKRG